MAIQGQEVVSPRAMARLSRSPRMRGLGQRRICPPPSPAVTVGGASLAEGVAWTEKRFISAQESAAAEPLRASSKTFLARTYKTLSSPISVSGMKVAGPPHSM